MLPKRVLMRGGAPRLAAAVRAVLGRPAFAVAAGAAAERLRAARVPYSEQAADWVEYAAALRHHGSFLHTQGQLMGAFSASSADVALLYAACAAGTWWAAAAAWGRRRRGGKGAEAPRVRSSGKQGSQGAQAAAAAAAADQMTGKLAGQQLTADGNAATRGPQSHTRRRRPALQLA